MVMKNFLIGLSKFVLGLILAMLIMSLAGLSMARYFMTRMVEQPERPTYENDLPEDQKPAAKAPEASDAQASDAQSSENTEPAAKTEPETKPEAEKETDSADGYNAYATTDLNLRSGPGTTYDSIGGVGTDENVTVLEEDGEWLKVQLSNGTEGWVSSSYVTQE
jgi:hypothetical protein